MFRLLYIMMFFVFVNGYSFAKTSLYMIVENDSIVNDTVVLEEDRLFTDTIISDSLASLTGHKTMKVAKDWATWKPQPKKALLYSLIPGGGQIYNHKYWKLPLVYGGFVGCIYAWRWNGQMYSDYSQAYLDIMDDDPETHSYDQFLHLGVKIDESNISRYQELFRKRKDRFRRYRDLSIFCLIGVYGLSIIDAYIDASLSEFDITDDLSLRITPVVMDSRAQSVQRYGNIINSSAMGVSCALTF